MASTTGWYYPALTFAMPFTGTNWELDMQATYNLDWCSAGNSYTGPSDPNYVCSSGAQAPMVAVSFSSGATAGSNYAGSDYALITRSIDAWYGSNTLTASYGGVSSSNMLNPADATIQNNIADGSYWYRIIRSGGVLTIDVSYDGTNYATVLSEPLTNPSSTYNELLLGAATFSTAGSFTDFGPVTITSLDSPVTTPGIPIAEGIGATWIQVYSPFSGDNNGNNYTTYEYATSSGGPWTMSCGNGVPGDLAWRRCDLTGLTPATPYYVRTTFYDPDGINGPAAQVIGPITTDAVSNNFVTIGQATAQVEDTNILVSLPATDDANMNSTGTVSVATSAGGPWTQSCGSMANIGPKQCRVHGLTNGASYYLQVSITDPDGVTGTTPQVIGPILYTGLTDLALNQPITADPGWGCCSNPAQLVDGVIEAANWENGFAWTGGTGDWGGGTPGIKQATIDLQTAQSVAASIGGLMTGLVFLPHGMSR